jgi:hypothetical protein
MVRDVAARPSAVASLLDTAGDVRTWANVARLCGAVACSPLPRLEPAAPVASHHLRPFGEVAECIAVAIHEHLAEVGRVVAALAFHALVPLAGGDIVLARVIRGEEAAGEAERVVHERDSFPVPEEKTSETASGPRAYAQTRREYMCRRERFSTTILHIPLQNRPFGGSRKPQ